MQNTATSPAPRFGVSHMAMILSLGLAISVISQQALAEGSEWKENFAACAGNSPFIDGLLAQHGATHRPLMRIGEMQAWAITGDDGKPELALTTGDGLTIIGKVIGPQGEDISAALLTTVPNASHAATTITQAQPSQASEEDSQAPTTLQVPTTQLSSSPPVSNLPQSTPAPQVQQQAAQLPENPVTTAPITATAAPSPEVQAGMNTIFSQATNERVWFSAATPKPGAPVVYMLADPACPHCQWTIDQMHSQITAGDIDLRIIFAPVTGVDGFNTSLSILHSENVAESFMAHMTSTTRGTAAVTQMNTTEADQAVIRGIVDNINWMRANRMPGVPFFLYMTDDGARFAFSELPSDILTLAKAL